MKSRFALTSLAFTAAIMATNYALAENKYDACMQNASNNASMAQCGGDWMKREDTKLNAVWKKLNAAAEDQTKTDLLAEQRLWNSYKESSCKFYGNGDWGREGQAIHYAACRASVIATRNKDLQDYMDFISGL